MGRRGTPYEELVKAMRAFVAIPSTLKFAELDEAHVDALAPERHHGSRLNGRHSQRVSERWSRAKDSQVLP